MGPTPLRSPPAVLLILAALAAATWLAIAAFTPASATTEPAHEPAFPPPDLTADKLALIVGIGEYPGNAPPDLPGPRNDVALVRDLLVDRFGFPPQNVRTLVDAAATHERIVRQFRDFLIANARFGTEVVFWFSGHGSRIVDRSGREKDGQDSTLVAYDSRAVDPQGGYDVADDELHSLLLALAQRTDRVVAVTDTCHSGGVFRGEDEAGVRFASEGKVPLDLKGVAGFWPEHTLLDDDAPERVDIARRYVHVAACSAAQTAKEYGADGKTYGTLTWFLAQALERAAPDDTWLAVLEDTRLRVTDARCTQTPCYEGEVRRRVFGGNFVSLPAGFRAEPLSDGRIAVRAGSLAGLVVGSVLDVYRVRETEPIGRAKVEGLDPRGDRAFASFIAPPSVDVAKSALRVVEVDRPETADRLAVACAAGTVERAELGAWLREVEAADAEYELEAVGDRFRLRCCDGGVLGGDDGERGGELAVRELAYRRLSRLPLEPGQFALRARFVAPTDAELAQSSLKTSASVAPVDAASSVDGAGAAADAGSQFCVATSRAPDQELAVLEVTNDAKEDLYVVVVSLEEWNHKTACVWGDRENEGLIRPGDARRIPVALSAPRGWALQRPMLDRYVVLGTLERQDCAALIGKPTRGGGGVAARRFGVTWCDLQTTAK